MIRLESIQNFKLPPGRAPGTPDSAAARQFMRIIRILIKFFISFLPKNIAMLHTFTLSLI